MPFKTFASQGLLSIFVVTFKLSLLHVFLVLATCFRTPASAAAASASGGLSRSPVVLAGRRSHKSKVDVDGLVQELGLVGAIDSGTGLGQRCVLDESIALWSEKYKISD